MPFEVFEDKKTKLFYLRKADGSVVNKEFKSLQSAINMGKRFMEYRKENPVVKGNRIEHKKQDGDGMKVQSVMFQRDNWTIKQAEKWLEDNDMKVRYKNKGIDTTKNYFRFRQDAPSNFDNKSYRIKDIGHSIKLVLGKYK